LCAEVFVKDHYLHKAAPAAYAHNG